MKLIFKQSNFYGIFPRSGMGVASKSFFKFLFVCLFVCLFSFFFWLCGLWDLSSLTRDQTHTLSSERAES